MRTLRTDTDSHKQAAHVAAGFMWLSVVTGAILSAPEPPSTRVGPEYWDCGNTNMQYKYAIRICI